MEHLRRAEELIRRELGCSVRPRSRTHFAAERLVRDAQLSCQCALVGQGAIGARPRRRMAHALGEVTIDSERAHARFWDRYPGNESWREHEIRIAPNTRVARVFAEHVRAELPARFTVAERCEAYVLRPLIRVRLLPGRE